VWGGGVCLSASTCCRVAAHISFTVAAPIAHVAAAEIICAQPTCLPSALCCSHMHTAYSCCSFAPTQAIDTHYACSPAGCCSADGQAQVSSAGGRPSPVAAVLLALMPWAAEVRGTALLTAGAAALVAALLW
jgi:hypothetical protein